MRVWRNDNNDLQQRLVWGVTGWRLARALLSERGWHPQDRSLSTLPYFGPYYWPNFAQYFLYELLAIFWTISLPNIGSIFLYELLAIFRTILLAQYWLNIYFLSSLTYFGHCNISLKLIQYQEFMAGIWLQSNVWIRGRGKGLGGLCQVTAVTTHPGDKRGVIGSKLRPTYLKHAAKKFSTSQLNLTLGQVLSLSLVATNFCTQCTDCQSPQPNPLLNPWRNLGDGKHPHYGCGCTSESEW